MNGVSRLITCFHSSYMSIVAGCYNAGFFTVDNGFIDSFGNVSCSSKCIACRIRADYATSTRGQRRFVYVERNSAPFVFGSRTCAVNKFQRGIIFSQRFDIFIIDFYINAL